MNERTRKQSTQVIFEIREYLKTPVIGVELVKFSDDHDIISRDLRVPYVQGHQQVADCRIVSCIRIKLFSVASVHLRLAVLKDFVQERA
jgi:hypothetical protein